MKYVAEKLFAFNKDLFEEGRQTLESTDLKAEYEVLKTKALKAKDSIEWLTEKKREEILADLREQFDSLATKAKKLEVELDKKFWRKKKWKELKAMIAKLDT